MYNTESFKSVLHTDVCVCVRVRACVWVCTCKSVVFIVKWGTTSFWRAKPTFLGVDGRIILKSLQEIEGEAVDWINSAQDRGKLWTVLNMVVKYTLLIESLNEAI
jgi:hypothetical protein